VITDQQVRRLVTLLQEGNPLIRAAVRAGMSEPTARKYERAGLMPSEMKAPRAWRTRPDPYGAHLLHHFALTYSNWESAMI
jgi:hypothetical protein